MKFALVVRLAALVAASSPGFGAAPSVPDREPGLIGYWKLQGDSRDYSGAGHDGVSHQVNFDAKNGAVFDGRASYIEIPDTADLKLGTGDFAISVWVHTEAALTDVLGDILSKYDPATRTGLGLGIMNYAGVTTAQSNYRNLSFGIDAGRSDKEWADCGKLGNAKYVMALTVCEGSLYAATYEHGGDEHGHVYRYEGGAKWIDLGFPDPANGVNTLASFHGQLYAGSARYNAEGSVIGKSLNWQPGGRVYRYEGGTKWTDCGKLGEADTAAGMAVFEDKLYATPMYKTGKGLYRYEGGQQWTFCGTSGWRNEPLTVYNGFLYAGSPDVARFLRYEGNAKWTDLGSVPDSTQGYSFAVYEGILHMGNWPTGSVFSYDVPTNKWTSVGQLGREQEVMGFCVYNGKLYGGTLPLGKVYRYDGPGKWTFTGRLDFTPGVVYRRIWSMAVFQGRLFAGTFPAGRVYSYEAGKCATYDSELAPGWRHIAAIRAAGLLKLYVDGRCVATSSAFNPVDFDLTNSVPLRIGFGQHDYFNGMIKSLRLYRRALSEDEVRALSVEGKQV